MWGTRIVIPHQEGRQNCKNCTRMKTLARIYVWWPGINSDIEKSARLCQECQAVQFSPPPAPLNAWKWTTRLWARLHLDFAGPFQGKMIVTIDAHSMWIEAICTPSTFSTPAIKELFTKFGLPETVVNDNGPGFTSQVFETFLKDNGITHPTSALHHSASNRLARETVDALNEWCCPRLLPSLFILFAHGKTHLVRGTKRE